MTMMRVFAEVAAKFGVEPSDSAAVERFYEHELEKLDAGDRDRVLEMLLDRTVGPSASEDNRAEPYYGQIPGDEVPALRLSEASPLNDELASPVATGSPVAPGGTIGDLGAPLLSRAVRYYAPHSDIVLQFVVGYSRFEYALKRSGYVKARGARDDSAESDWIRFAADVERTFQQRLTPEVRSAVSYLVTHPPKKQVVTHGTLGWRVATHSGDKRSLANVLSLVRTVRNNLFHGGKFPLRPVGEPARNVQLLRHCVAILEATLAASDEVKHAFDERPEPPDEVDFKSVPLK